MTFKSHTDFFESLKEKSKDNEFLKGVVKRYRKYYKRYDRSA